MTSNAEDALIKILDSLYTNLYRIGRTYDESLSVTVEFAYDFFTDKDSPSNTNDQMLAKLYKKYFGIYESLTLSGEFKKEELNSETFLYAITEIIQKWEEKAPLDKRRTKKDVVSIIQEVAKKLKPNGPYIDLAVGTGGITQSLKNVALIQDIDERVLAVAYIIEKFKKDKYLIQGRVEPSKNDSISTFNATDYDGVFIFDPPLGDLREKPLSWYNINSLFSRVISYNKAKSPSEILFLLNFLINAHPGAYFIGLFPENILYKTNSKEINELRRHLIENCLITAIRPRSGHVLLIGQKDLNINRHPEIPIVKIKNELNEKQLKFIISESLKGYDVDFNDFYNLLPEDYGTVARDVGLDYYNKEWNPHALFKVYKRQELEQSDYIIQLPIDKTYEEKLLEDPKVLAKMIDDTEDEIKTTWSNLKTIIDNLESSEEEQQQDVKEELWFEKEKNSSKVTDSLCFFYKHSGVNVEYYKLKPNNLKKWKKFNLKDHSNLIGFFDNLLTLFESGHIAIFDNNFKISFGQHIKPPHVDYLDIDTYLQMLSPLKWDKTKQIYNMLDKNVQKMFLDLSRYNIMKCKEDTLLKNKKLPQKEIIRALKILKEIGLAFDKNSEEKNIDLYDSYRPYHYLTDEVFD